MGAYNTETVLGVLGFVLLVAALVRAHSQSSSGPQLGEKEGILYFIGGITGPVKVGITRRTADQRLAELQTGAHQKLMVLGEFHVADAEDAEGKAHNLLAPYHIGGEWYKRSQALAFAESMRYS